jgi:membrane protein implicated in regulation of membrane protease activity
MLNPADEQRPIAQLAILGLIYGTVKLVDVQLGSALAVSLAAAAALLFPASVAVLGLERNVFKALYPPVLAHMVRGLGVAYLVALAVIGAYIAGIAALLQWVSFLPLELAIAIFGILSIFSMLGGALYERRHELGIDTHRSPERSAELERLAELRRSEAVVTEAYGLVRVGSHTRAWSMLQDWLAARGRSAESYHWLCQRVAAWTDPRYATRLTQEYIDRLITLRQDGQALDVVTRRLEQDPSFRPRTGAATLRIAQLAARGGGRPRIARSLLTDFATRFEGDPGITAAEALANELVR